MVLSLVVTDELKTRLNLTGGLAGVRDYQQGLGASRGDESRQTGRMRTAFAHDAMVSMELDADTRAPGAAVTVALCGSWKHDCRAIDSSLIPEQRRTWLGTSYLAGPARVVAR